MNTDTFLSPDGDDVPEAVRRADAGAQAWRAAVHAQQTARPDHADFYALAGIFVDTFAAMTALTRVLARQVERYAEGWPVYDDTRAVEPRERLASAALDLHELGQTLTRATEQANRFWSAIGHIGVEATP